MLSSPTPSSQKALSPLHFQSLSTLPYWHDSNSVHQYVNISTFSLSLQRHLCLVKNPPAMPRKPGFNPKVGKIPWRRERLPTAVFWPGEFHGLYNPWGCKSWTWLSNFHFHILLFTTCKFFINPWNNLETEKQIGTYFNTVIISPIILNKNCLIYLCQLNFPSLTHEYRG